MIATLLALTLNLQDPDNQPIELPPGTSAAVHSTVGLIEKASADGNWKEAERLAARLPNLQLSIHWDDSKIKADQKVAFKKAFEAAIGLWTNVMADLAITFKNEAELKISFTDTLPPNIDSPGPAAAVFIPSPDEGDPALEAVLALFRGKEKVSTESLDIFNEVVFSVGTSLGLARLPKPSSALYRAEEPTTSPLKVSLADMRQVRRVIEAADLIRKEIAAKRVLVVTKPQIYIEPKVLTPTGVSQGEEMSLSLQITNRGKTTLNYRVVPDCSCFLIGPYTNAVEPGRTVIVPMYINTIDFVGKLNKALYVYSNDPEMPVKRIPMQTTVRPAYRFVDKKEGTTIILDENGGTYDVILVLDDSIEVRSVSVSGISAFASYEKWEGELDDPTIGEGKKMRKGIKISALIAPNIATGRATMGILVETRHPVLKTLYHNVMVQRGIVPVPMSIYFGEIDQADARAHTILSRPGQPFKILSVKSNKKFIEASVEPFKGNSNYKIVAQYKGTAPAGRFFAKITVKTDDPKQPEIEIPIEGTVK